MAQSQDAILSLLLALASEASLFKDRFDTAAVRETSPHSSELNKKDRTRECGSLVEGLVMS